MNMNFEMLRELMERTRSVRRFRQAERIEPKTLRSLVGLCRYTPSGRNAQPLKYRIVHTPEECAAVFPLLKWAGYLTDWDGPAEGERPAAYMVQCLDTDIVTDQMCDDGLQLEAILLGATALGLSGCVIKAFNAAELPRVLGLPTNLKPLYVVALGKPEEKVVIEPMPADGSYRYWRTADGIHHVPKRAADDLIV